ncbi:MAG: lasso RiPP family leader peptide-containing protein [Pseudonocardia sp.]
MTEQTAYEAPVLVEIGTLHELTLQLINKQGPEIDGITGNTGITGQISLFP